MNRIEEFQQYFRQLGFDFLAESDCDDILTQYATFNDAVVKCPYKPRTFLTKASGNAGRTTVHIAYNKARGSQTGIGPVSFGASPFEAKLNYLRGLVEHKYFVLNPDLTIRKPLLF